MGFGRRRKLESLQSFFYSSKANKQNGIFSELLRSRRWIVTIFFMSTYCGRQNSHSKLQQLSPSANIGE